MARSTTTNISRGSPAGAAISTSSHHQQLAQRRVCFHSSFLRREDADLSLCQRRTAAQPPPRGSGDAPSAAFDLARTSSNRSSPPSSKAARPREIVVAVWLTAWTSPRSFSRRRLITAILPLIGAISEAIWDRWSRRRRARVHPRLRVAGRSPPSLPLARQP